MIRRLIPSDIPAVLELWLRSTKQAHPFIAPGYWDENTGLVKDMLTRQAETYVFVDKHRIKGLSVCCRKILSEPCLLMKNFAPAVSVPNC